MPKVSVIVPVFQVEKFLKNCLQSILTQTLTDIEIILLNDGSTDASLKICEEYAAKDKRISVYSHENRGLGSTRNRGITLAKGDYLAFVDSDDHISPDGLERLLQKKRSSMRMAAIAAKLGRHWGKQKISFLQKTIWRAFLSTIILREFIHTTHGINCIVGILC